MSIMAIGYVIKSRETSRDVENGRSLNDVVIGSSTKLEFQSFALPLKEIISRSSVWLTVLRSLKGLPFSLPTLPPHASLTSTSRSVFLSSPPPRRAMNMLAKDREAAGYPLLAVNRTVPTGQSKAGEREKEREREGGRGVDEVHQRVPFII